MSDLHAAPSLWRPIEDLVPDDTMVLASCPACADFPEGRVMIWRASILAMQNDRTPRHLRFPATRWVRLDDVVRAVTEFSRMRSSLQALRQHIVFDSSDLALSDYEKMIAEVDAVLACGKDNP